MVGKKSENKAVGRTKGGINTKIHAIVDGLGNPVAFLLSPGNDGDSIHAVDLMSKIDIEGSNLLGDKAYGTKEILAYIRYQRNNPYLPRVKIQSYRKKAFVLAPLVCLFYRF